MRDRERGEALTLISEEIASHNETSDGAIDGCWIKDTFASTRVRSESAEVPVMQADGCIGGELSPEESRSPCASERLRRHLIRSSGHHKVTVEVSSMNHHHESREDRESTRIDDDLKQL